MKYTFKFQGTRGRPLSKGVLGRVDPVAWAAMVPATTLVDVMDKAATVHTTGAAYAEARSLGRVGTSLALCRELRSAEAGASDAIDICRRIAGDEAAMAALNVGRAPATT